MASCARRDIVRPGQPGIFHCTARCVRRARLLGKDPLTGIDHDHRRFWVLERLEWLAENFAIDVGFHATMSNHLHLVLRAVPRRVKRMGDYEVARRWLRLYPGQRVLDGNWIEPTDEQVEQLANDKQKIQLIRKRLSNISWFMGALSEYVARRANLEDGCTGRFWEGRFFCREITDESALLICGMYVDLNQIRAGEAATPEESRHCSVGLRIRALQQQREGLQPGEVPADAWLAPLALASDDLGDVPSESGHRASDKGLLPLTLEEYLKLLNWTGRQVRLDKPGAIPEELAPILERLGIQQSSFVETVMEFPRRFRRLAGRVEQLVARAVEAGCRWFQGVRYAAQVFR